MVNGSAILAGVITFATFVATLFLVKMWIRAAKAFGLVGKDMNKFDKRPVAEAGGIAVIFSVIFGLFFYIFLKTFLLQTETHFVDLLGIAITVLLAGFIGFIDDILGWKKGLKQWQKPLLTIPIALPLVVLNAGHSTMNVPFLGPVNFGLLYPLLIVPIAIMGAANGYNLLAGFNGLEAGIGAIILTTLGLVALKTGASWLALVAFLAVAALLGFLLFNWYPARVFPGDSLTYSIGALIAVIAILGNMEKLAILLFLPFFIDAGLYAVGRVKDKMGDFQAFGKPNPDGTLELPYKKLRDSGHIAIWLQKKLFGKATEKGVTATILLFELLLCVAGFILIA
jgi:UDP-N-acetylglucosamine--dolichyl-phosphate N-acetylglucosaminephosphotransferase